MILKLILLLCTMIALPAGVVFEGKFASKMFGHDRFVRVALPVSYENSKDRRYPVLYIHDGQNAFTTAGPHAAFGWGNWELDKTSEKLAGEGRMEEVILVATDCSTKRYQEYRGPASVQNDESEYEKYRDFLVNELKPHIDKTYRTKPEPAQTAVLGSSMGGICSLALAWEKPEVFGKAASISGAYAVEEEAFLKLLKAYRGPRKPFKIYLDSGTKDFRGGDDGAAKTKEVVAELKRAGWKEGSDLVHFVDGGMNETELQKLSLADHKRKEALNSHHNELYWRLRVWRALEFLFPAK